MAYRYLRVNSYRVFRSSKYASFSLFELLDGCKCLVSRWRASRSTSSSITITMKARTRPMLTDFWMVYPFLIGLNWSLDICVYNVYNPNRAYKRTNPGVPDYKCIITKYLFCSLRSFYSVDLPAISPSILSLLQQYHEHTKDRYVTVLLIVVDNDGSVLLYKLHDTKQLSVEEFK